jgi:hypothetical protein
MSDEAFTKGEHEKNLGIEVAHLWKWHEEATDGRTIFERCVSHK